MEIDIITAFVFHTCVILCKCDVTSPLRRSCANSIASAQGLQEGDLAWSSGEMLDTSRNPSSAASFQSAAAILASALRNDLHPSRGASAVVAAHRPLPISPTKKLQNQWSRKWSYYKLSLVHTHKTCGMRSHLHQTDCLRCVERCGILPLISCLSKSRNRLKRLIEHSDVLHMIAFCLRYPKPILKASPDMAEQELQQRTAFGWRKILNLNMLDLDEDSDEEWCRAALMACTNRNL